ncbi:MAG: HU family DNA-binding protein [Pseudomonadota bacterium]
MSDDALSDAATGEGGADGAPAMRRKKDIVDHVANSTGLKKRDVREALDSCFAYVHASLSAGNEIAYPQLGKIRLQVQRPDSANPKTVYRVALAKVSETDEADTAEPLEDDA